MPKQQQLPTRSAAVGGGAADKPKPNKPLGPSTTDEAGDEVFEEDFTDVDAGGFPVAEEGSHHAKVIDFEKSDSKSGNPQYVWQFRITAGNSKDVEIRYWTSLLPQARWKVVETLTAIGIKAAGSIARFSRVDILGKPCIIEVIHEDFEGRTTHKVQRVHPPNQDSSDLAERDDDTPF